MSSCSHSRLPPRSRPRAEAPHPHDDQRQAHLRPRHQRADARSHRAVQVRGTRRLPADAGHRGTGQRQEGHLRSQPQCTPGQPLHQRTDRGARHRQAGHRHPADAAEGPATARGREHRQTALPDRQFRFGEEVRRGDAGQPDPRRDPGAAGNLGRDAGGIRLQGHQPADQGVDRRHRLGGLRERPSAGRLQPAVHRRVAAAGGFLAAPRREPALVDREEPHVLRIHP